MAAVALLSMGPRSIGEEVRDASTQCRLEVDDNGEITCADPVGPPPPPPDPYRETRFLVTRLVNMEDDLAPTLVGFDAHVEVGEPAVTQGEGDLAGDAPIVITDGAEVVATGTAAAAVEPWSESVDLAIETIEGDVTRTLELTVWRFDDEVTMIGTFTRSDGAATLVGGWIYSPGQGAQVYPSSDPGFDDEALAMLHISGGGMRGGGFGLGSLMTMIGNIVSLVVNSILDIFIPYTPPDSCQGPLVYDNAGQSCEGVDIACAERLSEPCTLVGDLPGVSQAFKKCMKGRCGCGGSNHRRARISCDDSDSCGPCSALPDCQARGCLGCNVGGSRIWYCDDTPDSCGCIKTTFHEMSHACGALDLRNGASNDAYRIGEWFKEEFDDRFPEECIPVLGGK